MAEMSPKRKFALDGFCCWFWSPVPWLWRDSPRLGSRLVTSFGSYGLDTKISIQFISKLETKG